MATLLIRCTLHDELPHKQFRDWIGKRREELTSGSSGVRAMHAAPLRESIWLLDLDVEQPASEPCHERVAALVGDLRLLGLEPAVFIQERAAAATAAG